MKHDTPIDRLKTALRSGRPAEIESVLYPGPRPHFRAVMDPDPALCRYYINDQQVSQKTFEQLEAQHYVPGVSKTIMDTPDSEDE